MTVAVHYEPETKATLHDLHILVQGYVQTMGVPSVETLMAQVEQAVENVHGPAPQIPTWEDLLAEWTAREEALRAPKAIEAAEVVIEAEITDQPAIQPAVRASAKALPAGSYKKASKRR